ncbi:MAG: hypothetical protein JRE57_01185 [Deltaproteobacteria bacterium]|nr:hypothetical protein [Deltaproteobacteria bacterium]
MSRFTNAFCNLILFGAALALATPTLAGQTPPTPTTTPTPTATPTATATLTPTATPTPTTTPTPTATLAPPVCGNGILEPGEHCDPPLTEEGAAQCGGFDNVCFGGRFGFPCTCGHVDLWGCDIDKKCSVGGSEPADQCEAMPGDEVTYTYIVGPVSAYTATVEVTDDKLGVVATDLVVPILGVVEFSVTATIFETTTNTAWITAASNTACQLPSAGASVTVTVPTPTPTLTPTPTQTLTPTPTPTATAEPTCSDLWLPSMICTIGKGQSPSNNPKVSMCITGNIVDPGSLGNTAHRIPVCAGTEVSVVVTDLTGTPAVSAGGSLSCNSAGCTGVVNVTEKFIVNSADGKDTDRMTLLPQP